MRYMKVGIRESGRFDRTKALRMVCLPRFIGHVIMVLLTLLLSFVLLSFWSNKHGITHDSRVLV